MAVIRRRQAPLSLDLPGDFTKAELCPLSALFLIYFDNKTGYAISWKRSLPGVDVEGVVEYKSLPSGVHSIKRDLIYFTHGNHVGLSAFINAPAAEESRNARMIAVGVMVPLFGEKIAKCWEHAEELKGIANILIVDSSMTRVLEEYWEKHKYPSSFPKTRMLQLPFLTNNGFKSLPTSPSQPRCHSRGRSLSDSGLPSSDGQILSTCHPASSMENLLDTFGPLIFPIYRAALLRQRILIITHAPVHETCNFVYNISLLSSVPQAGPHISEHEESYHSLRPLFSIGVHDIAFLEEELKRSKTTNIFNSDLLRTTNTESRGWIACTTDSILAMKTSLYDVLIRMPTSYSTNDGEKVWPKLESPPGVEMRATQRDFRRYKCLRRSLALHKSSFQDHAPKKSSDLLETDKLSYRSSITHENLLSDPPAMNKIIEPLSWSAFAYSNLTWWMSAGEQISDPCNESEIDTLLLSGLSIPSLSPTSRLIHCENTASLDCGNRRDVSASLEVAIITYFHRMTSQILSILDKVTNSSELEEEQYDESNPLQADSENSEYESRTPIFVRSTDIIRMGLDVWSDSDHRFIQNLVREYNGRRSLVEGLKLEMCGIRIC